jgi:tripartite-type tricarboxylate transporter receptor subunit TctC
MPEKIAPRMDQLLGSRPQALRLAARADELIKNLDHLEGPEVCSRSYRKRVLIGTTGNGSSPHISGVYLEKTLGISATMVPYRGAAPALQALMGGRSTFFSSGIERSPTAQSENR